MDNRYYIAKRDEQDGKKELFVYRGPFNTEEYATVLGNELANETGIKHVVLDGTKWEANINYESSTD